MRADEGGECHVKLVPRWLAHGRVAVIIVNFNGGAGLLTCVHSALSQCDQVIVVDNGSVDLSLLRVRDAYAGDARVVLLPQHRNLGFSAACNIGARSTDADWLLFLNPDCVLQRRAVEAMLKAISTEASVAMVGGLLLNPDGTEQAGGRRAVPTPWRSFVRAFGLCRYADRYPSLFRGYDLHRDPLPAEPEPVEAISGACMLVRRGAIEQVGLLDEAFFMHCEDLDWCMRFRRAGWQILFVPHARVVHEKGSCSRGRTLFVEWHKHKGMLRFYRKHFRHQYPGLLMGLVAIGVWLRFAGIGIAHLRRRLFSAKSDVRR